VPAARKLQRRGSEGPTRVGEMTSSITLADADGGTDLFAVHDRLRPGLSPADNETGWRGKLKRWLRPAKDELVDRTND
jgi:hypothetical protein